VKRSLSLQRMWLTYPGLQKQELGTKSRTALTSAALPQLLR
jgi:hypothetical protein